MSKIAIATLSASLYEPLKALAHPIRIDILNYIHQQGEVNVNRIYSSLHLEQSITSQHLKVMRLAGIVKSRKEERFMFYSIDYDTLEQMAKSVQTFAINKHP